MASIRKTVPENNGDTRRPPSRSDLEAQIEVESDEADATSSEGRKAKARPVKGLKNGKSEAVDSPRQDNSPKTPGKAGARKATEKTELESDESAEGFVEGPATKLKPNADAVDDDEPTNIYLPRDLVKRTGGGAASLLISQCRYWNCVVRDRKRLRKGIHSPDGHSWAPGNAEIQRQTTLDKWQTHAALVDLVEKKIIEGHIIEEESAKQVGEKGIEKGIEKKRLELPKHHRKQCIRFTKTFERRMRKRGLLGSKGLRGVLVSTTMLRKMKTVNQAILFMTIYPWFQPNKKGKSMLTVFDRRKRGWRRNSVRLLAADSGLTRSQVETALRGLKKDKWLIMSNDPRHRGEKNLHVHIDVAQVKQRLEE